MYAMATAPEELLGLGGMARNYLDRLDSSLRGGFCPIHMDSCLAGRRCGDALLVWWKTTHLRKAERVIVDVLRSAQARVSQRRAGPAPRR
jgi:hypothetical protein